MKLTLIDQLADLAAARQPAALVTHLATGAQTIFTPDTGDDAVAAAIADDRSGELEIDGRKCFVLVRNPPARIIVVGAVHITQAVAPMAQLAGYEVIIVDPRGAFATAERFPGVTLSQDWPDEALEKLKPDTRSAVITLTHDPKLDDPALTVALRSEAFYIGALGSKKTHASRVERLRAAGFADSEIARIHGPAGLDIGAKSPAEIALSVLAQLTAARRQKPTSR
ncbi:MAG: XdhC family protein [Rhodospirillaceae bacterium]|nr:XdhC family protein [Rhodospirillaceae bacterium]